MSGMSTEWKRLAPKCLRCLVDDDSFLYFFGRFWDSMRAFLMSGQMYDGLLSGLWRFEDYLRDS